MFGPQTATSKSSAPFVVSVAAYSRFCRSGLQVRTTFLRGVIGAGGSNHLANTADQIADRLSAFDTEPVASGPA